MRRISHPALPSLEVQPLDRARSPLKSGLASRLTGRSEPSAEEVQRAVQWRGLVQDARQNAHLSQKAMAADLGIAESQLSAQLAGAPNSHLSLWRMRGLSREFWQEFVTLLIAFYDLSVGADPKTQLYAEIGRRYCEAAALVESAKR